MWEPAARSLLCWLGFRRALRLKVAGWKPGLAKKSSPLLVAGRKEEKKNHQFVIFSLRLEIPMDGARPASSRRENRSADAVRQVPLGQEREHAAGGWERRFRRDRRTKGFALPRRRVASRSGTRGELRTALVNAKPEICGVCKSGRGGMFPSEAWEVSFLLWMSVLQRSCA